MKKSWIVYLAILISISLIQATSNKTHLTFRSQGDHAPLFYSIWREALDNGYKSTSQPNQNEPFSNKEKSRFSFLFNFLSHKTAENIANPQDLTGGAISITPYYSFSDERKKLARYFMFDTKTSLEIGRNKNIDNRYIKFDETASDKLTGVIKLQPTVKTYSTRIDYHQELKKLSEKLFLEISIPIVSVTNDTNLTIENGVASTENNKTIDDYFYGHNMLQQNEFTLQEPLAFGKFGKEKKTGVADVNIALGYHLIKKPSLMLNLKGLVSFPTSSSPKSKYLFEPTLGTAGHFGVGGTLEGFYQTNDNISFIYDFTYKYLFSDKQRRILGLKDSDDSTLKWGQYMLLGKANLPLVIPAANVLRQTVKVSPGSQLEGLFMLSCSYGKLITEAGYNFWWKESENVKKDAYWNPSEYGFVGSDYATQLTTFTDGTPQNLFSSTYSNLSNTISSMQISGLSSATQGTIAESQLDAKVAASPSAFTNKLFFTLGYEWPQKKSTYILGAGASYEFASSNTVLDETTIWLKGALVF